MIWARPEAARKRCFQELKSFDAEEERGVFRLLRNPRTKSTAMKAKYAKAETNINKISPGIGGPSGAADEGCGYPRLEMYELNKTYFKELSMYILAGKKKLKEVREGDLTGITARAQQSGLALRMRRKPGSGFHVQPFWGRSFMIRS